jgi:hypothetical protein
MAAARACVSREKNNCGQSGRAVGYWRTTGNEWHCRCNREAPRACGDCAFIWQLLACSVSTPRCPSAAPVRSAPEPHHPHPHSSFVDPLRPVRRAARGYCDFPCAPTVLRISSDDSICLSRALNPYLVFRSATPTPRLAACCLLAAHPLPRRPPPPPPPLRPAAIASTFVAIL